MYLLSIQFGKLIHSAFQCQDVGTWSLFQNLFSAIFDNDNVCATESVL